MDQLCLTHGQFHGQSLDNEVSHVSLEVGVEGILGGQALYPMSSGVEGNR